MAHMNQAKKAELAPGIKAVLKKYGMKGSISVRNYSSLVVTLKSGNLDFGQNDEGYNGYTQVNVYWIDRHYTGVERDFLNELHQAMMGPDWFCDDDIMTDYFHRSHYCDINVGSWDKPYVCNTIEMKEAA